MILLWEWAGMARVLVLGVLVGRITGGCSSFCKLQFGGVYVCMVCWLLLFLLLLSVVG